MASGPGETCESGAKVDREPEPVGLPTKTEERQHGADQSRVYAGCARDGPRVEAGEDQQVKGIAGRMDKDRVVFFRSWGNGH